LPPDLYGLRRGQRRNQGLAAPHIPLHQAQHGFACSRSRSISASAQLLRSSQFEGQRGSRPALRAPFDSRGQPDALDALSQ